MEQNVKKQAIATEFIRLDAFLKLCGAFETGGRAKLAVQGGQVRVNGEECRARGKKLRPGDRAEFGGTVYEVARA
ncbi:MAG TPA: RNA-binding S4 domain-containing protein [Ruminococcaceae bacterium]|jgi:ribosome-associated protein|nr:RNA-binding S4 domain-containing protein [Oscillospiraceae bacterium]